MVKMEAFQRRFHIVYVMIDVNVVVLSSVPLFIPLLSPNMGRAGNWFLACIYILISRSAVCEIFKCSRHFWGLLDSCR